VFRYVAMMVCALIGVAPAPADAGILFARNATVPRPVREFAWRVIETRCHYQSFEREQRSFWAYDAQQTSAGVYSINVLSERTWKKAEPPAVIAMTIVDDGGLRLTALTSSFAACASLPPA